MAKLSKREWTLLATALADGEPLSPVQLQKTLFLFGRLLPSGTTGEEFYQFFPHNYGPFCPEVYDDARKLAEEGFVAIGRAPGASYSQYTATPEALQEVEGLLARLPGEATDLVKRIVAWAQSQSFCGLVTAIYRQYPEFKVNSIFSG